MVFVRDELRVSWFGMSLFQKSNFNILFHGKLALALGVHGILCPFKFNSRKFGPLPICGDCVIFVKGL